MQTWAIVLIVVIGIATGFFIGVIFQKRRKHKKNTIGYLMVVDSESDREPPYIYLELHETVESIYSKKSVELKVKHVSHK